MQFKTSCEDARATAYIDTTAKLLNLFRDAVGALAGDGMGSVDCLIARQKHLYDLVVVVVGGEYQRRDVRRKLTLLVRTKERIFLRASTQLRAGYVVRMLDHHLYDIIIIIIIIIIPIVVTVQCVPVKTALFLERCSVFVTKSCDARHNKPRPLLPPSE